MIGALVHTPSLTRRPLSSNLRHHTLSAASSSSPMASPIRIAVVGDVHDDWNLQEDAKALQLLQPDLVLFTGDFGNENVELVRTVADLKFPKAVILGNHDTWNTYRLSGKKKNAVEIQLECLGEEHVGYRRLDFPQLKLSVVGGRPFSCGGNKIFRQSVLSTRYGVENMGESAERIYKAASGTLEDHLVILLAHNGPTGLGANISDICGKDWVSDGGDHGDPDLAEAISKLKETGKVSTPLVVFGHMHKQLARGKGLRKMIVVGSDNTIYLNGAIVPRVKSLINERSTESSSAMDSETESPVKGTIRAFTLVEILNRRVRRVAETWVSVNGDVTKLEEEHLLYKSDS